MDPHILSPLLPPGHQSPDRNPIPPTIVLELVLWARRYNVGSWRARRLDIVGGLGLRFAKELPEGSRSV